MAVTRDHYKDEIKRFAKYRDDALKRAAQIKDRAARLRLEAAKLDLQAARALEEAARHSTEVNRFELKLRQQKS